MSNTVDLGWMTDWRGKTPKLVELCIKQKHRRTDTDIGPQNKGMEHVVRCEICGYVYRYDSSD